MDLSCDDIDKIIELARLKAADKPRLWSDLKRLLAGMEIIGETDNDAAAAISSDPDLPALPD